MYVHHWNIFKAKLSTYPELEQFGLHLYYTPRLILFDTPQEGFVRSRVSTNGRVIIVTMQETNTISILVLTLLMMVGLFFFLRASAKDRTEEAQLEFSVPPAQLRSNLQAYLENRAYRLVDENDALVFEGIVAPSRFLAFFLSLLAFLGLTCLSLVLATLLPKVGNILLVFPLLSPVAGLYYWRRAGRSEQVTARIASTVGGSQLMLRAHRDEILALKSFLKIKDD